MTTRVRWARNWARFSSAWATASKTRLWRWRYSKDKNCPLKTSLGRPTPSSKSTYCLTESTNSRPKSRGRISTLTGTKPSCLKVFLVQTILSLILLKRASHLIRILIIGNLLNLTKLWRTCSGHVSYENMFCLKNIVITLMQIIITIKIHFILLLLLLLLLMI